MKKAELVFIPTPAVGHLVSALELAKRLTQHDDRISVTVLVMRLPPAESLTACMDSLATSVTGIRFIELPQIDPPPLELLKSPESYISVFIEKYKPHVKNTVINLLASESTPPRLAGFVVDLCCTTMIDVGNDLGVPSYLFFPSGAAFLGLMLHLPILDTQITTEFSDSDSDLVFPTFFNPVSPRLLPTAVLNRKDDSSYLWYLYLGRRFRETKGIIVNTFPDLEPHAISSLAGDHQTPRLFPIGPLIDLKGRTDTGSKSNADHIIKWLDHQPPSSVVFLCFGSMGCFGAPQVKEIAIGLERSGFRFLWSLREPAKTMHAMPTAYTNPGEVLPDGFLERTEGRGLVCGWVPQKEVLAHNAIGGFVSHCGWNSILESLWFGVPVATWPLYAEQQINAFEMARELNLATEMRLDYRLMSGDLVVAEEVEGGVRRLMEGGSEVRKKVEEMKEKSRKAVIDGGSSFKTLGLLIEDLTDKD